MDVATVADWIGRVARERTRTQIPEGFPALPDIPAGRYRDPAFFAQEQKAVWHGSWLYAGHTLLVALVGQRLMSITPHLDPGEHLRHRQMSGILLIATSLLAIALSFANPRLALLALALNFAAPLIRKWSYRWSEAR